MKLTPSRLIAFAITLGVGLFLAWPVRSAGPIFVRNDGSDTNCSGLVDAADPGSGGLPRPCALATVPAAITAAACGDTIKAKAGHSWDTGGITLPNKSCTVSTPITITSTAVLPNRRVGPADASLMPRFRTTGGGAAAGAFITAANAGWWVLDGLEITDNAGSTGINMLVDVGSNAAGPHDFTMTRCYVHQKETGSNYERSVIRAMQFEGVGLTYTRNYIEDFIGYPYGLTEPHNTAAMLSVSGQQILMEDNYLSAWWNTIFLGGGDTAPTQTATLTSASTTTATFSNVTGLSVGQFIRFSVVGVATLSNAGSTPTLTKTSGEAWVTADSNQNNNYGDSVFIRSQGSPSESGITRLMNLTGDNVFTTTSATSSVAAIPNGAVDYEIYQTAKITNIAGSVITYDPTGTTNGLAYGTNSLNHVPATAAWTVGDQGRVVDVTVRKNTFYVNPVFAAHLVTIGRGCPKGLFEMKSVDRFTFEGNYILGYPAVLAFTTANQNGSSPWVTVDHVTIRNNWIAPDTGFADCSRGAFIIADDAYLNTITPTSTVTITNNLIIGGIRGLGDFKNGNLWTINHNTILNGQGSTPGPNALVSTQSTVLNNLQFKDNIGHVVCSGFNGYPSSYAGSTILNNVLVDADSGCSGGINVNTFGTGSGLSPIAANDAAVGFANLSACLTGSVAGCALSGTSNYENDGTDGLDPGIDAAALAAALGTGGSSVGVNGKVTTGGRVVIQ